jgi:two-component system, OmpR family, response regulator
MSATADNNTNADKSTPMDLDLTGYFAGLAPVENPVINRINTPQQEQKLSEEAVIGESKLTSNGFFVRINEAAPRRKPRNTPPVILVIEDDDTTAAVIVSTLETNSYKVTRAGNRQQIVDGMKLGPDLVLLDVMLPDANGFDVLARMRGARDFADTPVLMLTSLGALDDILKGLKLGANGYLTKPAKSKALLDAIKQVLA